MLWWWGKRNRACRSLALYSQPSLRAGHFWHGRGGTISCLITPVAVLHHYLEAQDHVWLRTPTDSVNVCNSLERLYLCTTRCAMLRPYSRILARQLWIFYKNFVGDRRETIRFRSMDGAKNHMYTDCRSEHLFTALTKPRVPNAVDRLNWSFSAMIASQTSLEQCSVVPVHCSDILILWQSSFKFGDTA